VSSAPPGRASTPQVLDGLSGPVRRHGEHEDLWGDRDRRFRRPHAVANKTGMANNRLRACSTPSPPVAHDLADEAAVGSRYEGRIKRGETVRIFTGAPLPRAVIP
jgi:hypothetical protein